MFFASQIELPAWWGGLRELEPRLWARPRPRIVSERGAVGAGPTAEEERKALETDGQIRLKTHGSATWSIHRRKRRETPCNAARRIHCSASLTWLVLAVPCAR
jgi:hypothetical protein